MSDDIVTIRVPNGYKCACCGKYLGDFVPDDPCSICGCITAEVRFVKQPVSGETQP